MGAKSQASRLNKHTNVYIYMYILHTYCVYNVGFNIYIYVYVNANMHTHTHIETHTHTYNIYIYIQIYICLYTLYTHGRGLFRVFAADSGSHGDPCNMLWTLQKTHAHIAMLVPSSEMARGTTKPCK